MNHTLEFSNNWNNKLDCMSFSTLRLSPRFNVGDVVEVSLKGVTRGPATCVYKKAIPFGMLNDAVAYLDTGYNALECQGIIRKMYPKNTFRSDTALFFYVFKYKEKTAVDRLTEYPDLFHSKQSIKHEQEQ